MRRSLLFIPGNNPAMLQNADVFGSDAVILDLEDAVSVTEKDSARYLVHYFLESFQNPGLEIVIRINELDTSFAKDDLDLIVSDHIDTIMLPKARISEVKELDQILTTLEKQKGLTKKIGIIPIIELASSVLEIDEVSALPRVNGLLLGAEDLSSDLEVSRTKLGNEIWYPRARIAFASKAYQIDAIDTPFTDTLDFDGLREDALRAQNLGLNAKAAIHPNQIETIHEVFSPSPKMIEWAKRIMEANQIAQQKNLGVFSLDGKMVDKPIIARAEKILAKARKFNII